MTPNLNLPVDVATDDERQEGMAILPTRLFREMEAGDSIVLTPGDGVIIRIELMRKSGRKSRLKIETYQESSVDRSDQKPKFSGDYPKLDIKS